MIGVRPRRRLPHDHSLKHVNMVTRLGQIIHPSRAVRDDRAHVHVHLTEHIDRVSFKLRQQLIVHAAPKV